MAAMGAGQRSSWNRFGVLPVAVRALKALWPAFIEKKDQAALLIVEPGVNLLFIHCAV